MPLIGWTLAALLTVALCRGALRWGRDDADAMGAGPWQLALRRLRADRWAVGAFCIIVALCVLAALAPVLTPYDPASQLDIVALKSRAPSSDHPFGTDVFSRDVLSRVLHGARVSLGVALLAVLLSITIGTAYGAVAGFAGGRTDALMMRLIDALLATPRVVLLIAILSLWGRISLPLLVFLIGATGWFGVSRIVRGQVLALREQEFVLSARALGASDRHILVRHVLPNLLSPVIVAATLGIGHVIILEAGLSFLGIGVRPPAPSWGNIIQDGSERIDLLWWVPLFPGLMIVLTVMAFNTLGDGLRDALDPRITVDRVPTVDDQAGAPGQLPPLGGGPLPGTT